MASNIKISAQEKKDLDKFTKFLALKSAQIIVQSRLGEKIQTKCNPQSSGTHWFNLAINDLPEVLAEAKSAMSTNSRLPLCVEISLRTVEGDTMVLETWCVGVHPDITDPSVRVTYTIYNRMGILLKSLLSVSRVTPAYKLSRRQGPDSYIICYRIYMGDPQLTNLGEGYIQAGVGQISTPVGTIYLSVAYRTKMTISPQHSKDTIMLKSDHFRPDFSPKHNRSNNSDDINSSLSETIKIGAFAESIRPSKVEPEMMPEVPFSSLLRAPSTPPKSTAGSPPPVSESPDQQPLHPLVEPSPPQDKASDRLKDDSENGNIFSLEPSLPSLPTHNDFIMKTPFAGSNANTELGLFYRECATAPPLTGCCEEPKPLAEQVGDLTKQLEQFETSLKEYDNLITQLCNGSKEDNNN